MRQSSGRDALWHNDALAPSEPLSQVPKMPKESAEARRAALRRFMDAHALKPKPWAEKAGLSASIVRNFLAGRAESLSGTTLEKLAKAANASVAELIGEKGAGRLTSKDVVTVKGIQIAQTDHNVAVTDGSEGEPFYFRKGWLERHVGKDAGVLRVIRLKDDSMVPTLRCGDVALVHLRCGDPSSEPGVYCVWSGGALIVRRLQAITGTPPRLRILSDNSNLYPPYEVGIEDVKVIGKVIWRGGII